MEAGAVVGGWPTKTLLDPYDRTLTYHTKNQLAQFIDLTSSQI